MHRAQRERGGSGLLGAGLAGLAGLADAQGAWGHGRASFRLRAHQICDRVVQGHGHRHALFILSYERHV